MTKAKNQVNDLMKTSIGGMAGLSAIGSMSGLSGMPSNNVGGLASAGVNLAQLGHVANIGRNIIPRQGIKKDKKSKNNIQSESIGNLNEFAKKTQQKIVYEKNHNILGFRHDR